MAGDQAADSSTDTGDAGDETTSSTSTDDAADTGATVDWAGEAAKWKALARKHESAAKRNQDAADKLAQAEDKDKSETERLRGQQAAAQERADKAERQLLLAEVAWDAGLTRDQAKRLVGDTREELEADAKELLASFGAGAKADDVGEQDTAQAKPRRRPAEKLRPGAAPAKAGDKVDPGALAEKILGSPF